MPLNVRKLTAEEIADKFPARGKQDLTEYKELFVGLKPRDGAVVTLPRDVSVRAMKRRLGQAAKAQLGEQVKLHYDVDQDNGTTEVSFQLRDKSAPKAAGGRKRT